MRYVAPGTSNKSVALRQIVRNEFAKHRTVQDEAQIQSLQANAIRALSNYLLFQSARSDPKVQHAVREFHNKHVSSAQQQQQQQEAAAREKNTKNNDTDKREWIQ